MSSMYSLRGVSHSSETDGMWALLAHMITHHTPVMTSELENINTNDYDSDFGLNLRFGLSACPLVGREFNHNLLTKS
jgi:hypothetical protein